MEFKHKLKYNTTEDLNLDFANGNKELNDIIVEVCLENLNSNIDPIPIVEITTKDDDIIYEVEVTREDLIITLQSNLKVMEEYEDFESCIKIKEGILKLM